mgnify:CR=1 FL=1
MLKKIDKSQARIGMFIEDLEGSWNENPFQAKRFRLNQEEQLLNCNCVAVIINTALGVDVEGTQTAKPRPARSKPKAAAAALTPEERIRVTSELIAQSEEVVEDVFKAVRVGGELTIDQVKPVVSQISRAMHNDPLVYLNVSRLKSKDETTFRHSIAVSALMLQFGRYLKLKPDVVQLLGLSGLLHDIGKMKIPAEVLTKEGGLTDDEFALIRNHPALGHAILTGYKDIPPMVLEVCRHHHERMDGKGYPDGLSGDQLSLPVRISAICDVFEAITSVRPYKKAWTQSDAIAWMLERPGHFDKPLVRQFVACLDMVARNANSAAA